MSSLKSYILTKDYASPYVVTTGHNNPPTVVKVKKFKKGEIINGEMKHANNQPAFVMVNGTLMFPLSVIREVITKEISSNADGDSDKKVEDKKPAIVVTKGGVKIFDAIIIGAIVGFAGVILAEKQGWITSPDKKNKLYGAAAGALAGVYIAYKFKK